MHRGLEGLVVKGDALDPAHHHPGAFDGRLGLESTNIVKAGRHLVGGLKAQTQQIGRLQCQKGQGQAADQHKQADPNIIF